MKTLTTTLTANINTFPALKEKEENLRAIMRKLESVVIAYSGGVDSTLVAKVAHEELGENALLVIADSPSLPRSELADAIALANTHRLPLRIVRTGELNLFSYQANPTNRCYYCKDTLYREIELFLADSKTCKAIVNGDHYEDSYGENFARRPGALAAQEHGVYSPLRSARFTKADIRALAQKLGLPNAEKPASPCLSSRIPTGSRVTEAKLSQIEQAEKILRACIKRSGGSSAPVLRVRHLGPWAKIEIAESERGVIQAHAGQIVASFREIGFSKVYLKKSPFASGSLSGKSNQPKDLIDDSEELAVG